MLKFDGCTVIVPPAGAWVWTVNVWDVPVTFIPVREVVTTPDIVGALMLGMLASIRCSGSAPSAAYCAADASKVRVGLIARFARIDPAPVLNGSAGLTPSGLRTAWIDDVISADLIWPGVQVGWAALTSADTPAPCGEDIDVPAMAMNRSPGGPLAMAPDHGCGLRPARISIPGAVTSGLSQSPRGPR